MSEPINDGGPAFPRASGPAQAGVNTTAREGMSLRDWFAGQALPAILRNEETLMVVCKALKIGSENAAALMSYNVADEMLAAREKGNR